MYRPMICPQKTRGKGERVGGEGKWRVESSLFYRKEAKGGEAGCGVWCGGGYLRV